jgi:hypothetical protein
MTAETAGNSATSNKETVSEKKRRGRPPMFNPEFDAAIRGVWSDRITTKRSLRNKQYMARGTRAIRFYDEPNERYRWFAGDGTRPRQAIFVELGRIAIRYGDATAVAMADKLVQHVIEGKLSTTREAAAWLRRARLSATGRSPEASAEALERLITTTIITWVSEHPDATPEMVRQALCGTYSLPEILEDMSKRPAE